MSKKLQGNGLWENSRMMLPEHKAEIVRSSKEIKKQKKPLLHEDEIATINENISKSFGSKAIIEISRYGEWGNDTVSGVVTSIQQYHKKFKVEMSNGYEWIDFDEVISVRLNGSDDEVFTV